MSLSRLEENSNPLHSPVCELFFTDYPAALLSVYLQQREKFYTEAAWAELMGALSETATLYVGNLDAKTREEQIFQFFSQAGTIRDFHMGLNAHTKTPTGFCFVEFSNHREAENARFFLSGAALEGKTIKVDLDMKFEEGRQWGRAKSGGQIIEDLREKFLQGDAAAAKRRAIVEKVKQGQRDQFKGFQGNSAAVNAWKRMAGGEEMEINKRQKTEDFSADQQQEEFDGEAAGDEEENFDGADEHRGPFERSPSPAQLEEDEEKRSISPVSSGGSHTPIQQMDGDEGDAAWNSE